VNTVADERPPTFIAACLAASGGHVLASLLVGVVMIPLTLVTWTGIVFSGDPSAASLRLLLPWLLVLAAQPLVAAWIAQRLLGLFDAGRVTYGRACCAMLLGFVATVFSAFVLPAEAALPVFGYAWTGALAAAVVLTGQPRAVR
jgi:hypothetical protein